MLEYFFSNMFYMIVSYFHGWVYIGVKPDESHTDTKGLGTPRDVTNISIWRPGKWGCVVHTDVKLSQTLTETILEQILSWRPVFLTPFNKTLLKTPWQCLSINMMSEPIEGARGGLDQILLTEVLLQIEAESAACVCVCVTLRPW